MLAFPASSSSNYLLQLHIHVNLEPVQRIQTIILCRGECSGCHREWALAFAPRYVHERSAVIGILTKVSALL